MARADRSRALNLRLDPTEHDRLAAIAEVEGLTVSDVVRRAIAEHTRRRPSDLAFQAMAREHIDRHALLMEMLAADDDSRR